MTVDWRFAHWRLLHLFVNKLAWRLDARYSNRGGALSRALWRANYWAADHYVPQMVAKMVRERQAERARGNE